MQSQSPHHDVLPTDDVKHAPLWRIACLIFAIVFGPALIAGILSLLH